MLVLRGSEIAHLLKMPVAITLVEQVLRDYSAGRASNGPRTRVHTYHPWVFAVLPGSTPSVVGAQLWLAKRSEGALGPSKHGSEVNILFDLDSGIPIAMLVDCFLNFFRTGAAGGVGIKYLAPEDARIVGILGSNNNAKSQLEAACRVRPIEKALVYSPTKEHKLLFAKQMSQELGIEVIPAHDSYQVVNNADILITATSSMKPVFDGDWLRRGMHINSIANGDRGRPRGELDVTTFRRSDLIFVTHKDTVEVNKSDVWRMAEQGIIDWNRVREIAELVGGKTQGRMNNEQITLFKPQGMGMWDIAVLEHLYIEAKRFGLGNEI